ncbi:hypothetical protein, variant 1 [Aphanomyces astaci]|uniref:Uncharacterized protein n=1 Tax=Aphanomyces astaci TaxID=112090 RepID=W4GNL3_APHAT|nr:hypothetical protein, variant 1 [Aphanomyces astaci]ETV81305.1 hypothetical protein, variant 1 [Aphanomyces astaci]|eukprot:XP_009829164.1 hypothetical protein, variant 1 [Aphanomyces astaci]
MTTTHLADAYAEYEATVQRRAEVTRRRAGRLGRKRQQERQAIELENQAAEGAATLAMRGLDAECRAVERIWRASDALKAYELEQFIYTQSAKCRIVATKEHLGEETPGLRGHKRLTVLQKRVDSFNDRVELANVACAHIEQAPAVYALKRNCIAGASKVWWGEKLETAVVAQNCVAVVHMLEKGADPDQESWNHMTPLLCCLVQRRHDLLRRCLELHANPNFETQDGKTPLLVAIVADDIVAMQILLEPRWKCSPWTETVRGGVTPLLVACEKGRLAAVQLLLAQPSSSIQGLRGNTVHGITPLMQAAKANHLAVARLLLRHNVNPFVHCKADRSAAEYARAFGHVRMERLVARGNEFNLDPSTPPTYEERMESSALDAIHLALDRSLASTSIDGVLEIVRGDGLASPNHESPDGHMAFLVACAKGDLATVQVLMQLCLWSQPNRHGTTGLLEAASHGHLDVVLHVVSQGGDLNYRDLKGRDAFMRMHDGGHHDMLQYLVQYKAKNNMLLPWWQLAPLPQPGAPLKAPSKLSSLQPRVQVNLPAVHPRPICAQCQDRHSSKHCHSCETSFCDQCYWRFHLDARRRHHEYHVLAPEAAVAAAVVVADPKFDGWHPLHLLLTCQPDRTTNQELHAIRKQKHDLQVQRHVATIEAHAAASIQNASDDHAAALQLAAVHRDLGKFDAATTLLRDMEALGVTWQSRRALAQLHVAEGNIVAAVECYKQAFSARLNEVAVDHQDIQALLVEFYSVMDKAQFMNEAVVMATTVCDIARRSLPRRHPFLSLSKVALDHLKQRREECAMSAEDFSLHPSEQDRKSLDMCTALLRDSAMTDVVSTFCRLNQQTKSLRLWRDMQTLKSVARPSKVATSTAHRIVKTFPTVHCIPSTMYRKVVAALSCAQWPADLAAVLGPCERILVASLYQSMVVPFLQTQAGQSWMTKHVLSTLR